MLLLFAEKNSVVAGIAKSLLKSNRVSLFITMLLSFVQRRMKSLPLFDSLPACIRVVP